MPKQTTPQSKGLSRRNFLRGVGGFIANHWLRIALPVGGAGMLGWAEYDTLVFKREHWDLFYPTLPKKLIAKKICHLSDLHLESLQISAEDIRKAVMTQQPDIIVITGDLINSRSDLDKLNRYLSNYSAPLGKYMVMGNNDYSHLSRTLFKRYLKQLESLGWIPLINDSTYLPNLKLWIIGVDDPATAHDDVDLAYQKVSTSTSTSPKSDFRLVLAHSSDCLDAVASYGADLLLTGHTHGGQIRLPGLDPLITNTYLGDLGFYEGYHIINDLPLYINRGLGESSIPLRFNVPPEISFFTLQQGDSPPRHITKDKDET